MSVGRVNPLNVLKNLGANHSYISYLSSDLYPDELVITGAAGPLRLVQFHEPDTFLLELDPVF